MIESDTKYYYQTLDISWDNLRKKQKESKACSASADFFQKKLSCRTTNKNPN